MLSKLQLILVDFDGTLADSLPSLWKCYLNFLLAYHIEGSRAEFEQLNGPSLPEIVTFLQSRYLLPLPLQELLKQYQQLVAEAYQKDITPKPGAREFLEKARTRGLQMSIVTSAPFALVQAFLQHNQLEGYFTAIYALKEQEPSKPHPAIYLRALSHSTIPQNGVIAIEDSLSGAMSAHLAGLDVILFDDNPCSVAASAISHWNQLWDKITPLL